MLCEIRWVQTIIRLTEIYQYQFNDDNYDIYNSKQKKNLQSEAQQTYPPRHVVKPEISKGEP